MTPLQQERFEAMEALYLDWNSKINVISRKDTGGFYLHHVLHSLAIAKTADFAPGTKIIDVGTGGGFPGIPLAVMFPQCGFTLVDSIGKKIKVASAVASALGLENVTAVNDRVENQSGKFDFAVSRAVTSMDNFMPLVRGRIIPGGGVRLCLTACCTSRAATFRRSLGIFRSRGFITFPRFLMKNFLKLSVSFTCLLTNFAFSGTCLEHAVHAM